MKDFAHLLNHPDISFSLIPDAIKVDNPATGEALAFVRKTDSDGLKLLLFARICCFKLKSHIPTWVSHHD